LQERPALSLLLLPPPPPLVAATTIAAAAGARSRLLGSVPSPGVGH
jgi:hypothetical protein